MHASPSVAAFVAALPKVELHLHLIGSASPDSVLTLARRHPGGNVPTDAEALHRFYAFTDFAHFLDVYSKVNLLVRTGSDVLTLLVGIGAELAARNVRYAEVQVTPVRNRMAGISFGELAEALTEGRRTVRQSHGVELSWIFDTDTTLGQQGAAETAEFAMKYRPEGTIGLGLAGPETGVRRSDYAAAFRSAREAGLHSLPHASETVGPEQIWSAVRDLGAERIGHGIGAAADPGLMEYLAEHRIALEVCPTSNVCTGAVPSLAEHPLPALLDAGVPVTLATDDPGMFGTDLNSEYLLCHTEFGIDTGGLAELARAGARAAFCSEECRRGLLAEIDALTRDA